MGVLGIGKTTPLPPGDPPPCWEKIPKVSHLFKEGVPERVEYLVGACILVVEEGLKLVLQLLLLCLSLEMLKDLEIMLR